MKTCSKCKETKDESEFHKNKGTKDGLRYWCKVCHRASKAKWQAANPEKHRAYTGKWQVANPEKRRAAEAKRRAKSPEKHRAYVLKWKAKNPGYKVKPGYYAKYKLERRRKDPQYALACALRKRLNNALKGNFKTGSAVRDLGMTMPVFKDYIETMFLPGMSWDNYGAGGWDIDHIYPFAPKCGLDLTVRENVLAVCNYRNLQPMWHEDNIAKGNAVTPEAQALFDELLEEARAKINTGSTVESCSSAVA